MQFSFSTSDEITTVAISGRITYNTLDPGHDPLALQVPDIYSRRVVLRYVGRRIHRLQRRKLVVDLP